MMDVALQLAPSHFGHHNKNASPTENKTAELSNDLTLTKLGTDKVNRRERAVQKNHKNAASSTN